MSGASWTRTLVDIAAPLMRSGVVVAWVMVFAVTLRELSMAILLYVKGLETLPVAIFSFVDNGSFEKAAAVSVVLIVRDPAVLSVIPVVAVPATSVRSAGGGGVTFGSDVAKWTVGVALFTRFQYASVAWTVTVKAVPAVCPATVPDRPVAVPGAADSPGRSTRSFAAAPAVTVTAELVADPSPDGVPLTYVAVTVREPPVFSVTEKLRVPAASAALAGRTAFGSLLVMPTVGVAVVSVL
jgi:hypothetical protein